MYKYNKARHAVEEQSSIPVSGTVDWDDGQEVELGKDFYVACDLMKVTDVGDEAIPIKQQTLFPYANPQTT